MDDSEETGTRGIDSGLAWLILQQSKFSKGAALTILFDYSIPFHGLKSISLFL